MTHIPQQNRVKNAAEHHNLSTGQTAKALTRINTMPNDKTAIYFDIHVTKYSSVQHCIIIIII